MGMTDTMTEPISTRNLDRYGSAELPWSRPRDILASDTPEADLTFFVATVRPDGRPHSAGVGATWVDGTLYFTSGPGTLKSRNLAANPACSVSVRLRGIDLVLEGEAHRVIDASTLERLAAVYRTSGWPASVEGDTMTAPVQRAQRRPRALAPIPPHAAHRRRRGHRRAPWRHPLGLRPLSRRHAKLGDQLNVDQAVADLQAIPAPTRTRWPRLPASSVGPRRAGIVNLLILGEYHALPCAASDCSSVLSRWHV